MLLSQTENLITGIFTELTTYTEGMQDVCLRLGTSFSIRLIVLCWRMFIRVLRILVMLLFLTLFIFACYRLKQMLVHPKWTTERVSLRCPRWNIPTRSNLEDKVNLPKLRFDLSLLKPEVATSSRVRSREDLSPENMCQVLWRDWRSAWAMVCWQATLWWMFAQCWWMGRTMKWIQVCLPSSLPQGVHSERVLTRQDRDCWSPSWRWDFFSVFSYYVSGPKGHNHLLLVFSLLPFEESWKSKLKSISCSSGEPRSTCYPDLEWLRATPMVTRKWLFE